MTGRSTVASEPGGLPGWLIAAWLLTGILLALAAGTLLADGRILVIEGNGECCSTRSRSGKCEDR